MNKIRGIESLAAIKDQLPVQTVSEQTLPGESSESDPTLEDLRDACLRHISELPPEIADLAKRVIRESI